MCGIVALGNILISSANPEFSGELEPQWQISDISFLDTDYLLTL